MEFNKLTESEQLIMKCIWSQKRQVELSDVVRLSDRMFHKVWKPQTVSTFLSHLVKKGYLRMHRDGKSYKYEPLVMQKDYAAYLFRKHLSLWNDNSMSSFVANLCDGEVISKEDLKLLKESLNEIDI